MTFTVSRKKRSALREFMPAELRQLRAFKTPVGIQRFLSRSRHLYHGCASRAWFSTFALDLEADNDSDRVLAIFKSNGATRASVFDFRSPIVIDSTMIWTPVIQPLRNEQRFRELLKAMKLPEYWRVAGWGDFCRPKGPDDFECVVP